MPDDLTMASIYILPFAGRVDQKLRSIMEASRSGAQRKAYISRMVCQSKFHMQLIPAPWDWLLE